MKAKKIYGTVYAKKGKVYLFLKNKKILQKRLGELMGCEVEMILVERKIGEALNIREFKYFILRKAIKKYNHKLLYEIMVSLEGKTFEELKKIEEDI